MTKKEPPGTKSATSRDAGRAERLAAELRANLRRRKAQTRRRSQADGADPEARIGTDHDAEGPSENR